MWGHNDVHAAGGARRALNQPSYRTSPTSAWTALIALVSVFLNLSCATTKADWDRFAYGLIVGLGGTPPGAQPQATLLLYGGPNSTTYLGCLNCSPHSTDSVLNQYGPHGSAYSPTSIRNRYSEYGSQFSLLSCCNPYALDPPVIVDRDGQFYGRLTLNRYHHQAQNKPEVVEWLQRVVCHS